MIVITFSMAGNIPTCCCDWGNVLEAHNAASWEVEKSGIETVAYALCTERCVDDEVLVWPKAMHMTSGETGN